jgi:transcriptional regulator GlxA family with amidase domain
MYACTGPVWVQFDSSGFPALDDIAYLSTTEAGKVQKTAPGVGGDKWRVRLGVVIALMTRRLGESVTNADMARSVGMSVRAFERSFLREYGLPPQQYLKRLRIQTACRLLVDTRESIAAVSLRCGFADQSHLTREFRRVTGLTPGAYRDKYAAANIPRPAVSVLSRHRTKR